MLIESPLDYLTFTRGMEGFLLSPGGQAESFFVNIHLTQHRNLKYYHIYFSVVLFCLQIKPHPPPTFRYALPSLSVKVIFFYFPLIKARFVIYLNLEETRQTLTNSRQSKQTNRSALKGQSTTDFRSRFFR